MNKYENLESLIKRLSVPMLENTEVNNYNRICNSIRQMYQQMDDKKDRQEPNNEA